MSTPLNPEITAHIRSITADLPIYLKGPGKDYGKSPEVYVANITLLHDETMIRDTETGMHVPNPRTKALIVTRGAGDAPTGSKSGVSGHVDTAYDPEGNIPDDDFDPIVYTARQELQEECNLEPNHLNQIEFHLGQHFTQEIKGNRLLHILPLVGICLGQVPPPIRPDMHELLDHSWVPLEEVAQQPNLSNSYLAQTLPRALGSLKLHEAQIRALLNLPTSEQPS